MIGSWELRSNNSTIFAEIFYIGIVLHTGLTPVFPFNFLLNRETNWLINFQFYFIWKFGIHGFKSCLGFLERKRRKLFRIVHQEMFLEMLYLNSTFQQYVISYFIFIAQQVQSLSNNSKHWAGVPYNLIGSIR